MLGLGKKKKITQVADAIAPLQKVIDDLQGVADHQHAEVESKTRIIESLTIQKENSEKEAALAENQVGKMREFFGFSPKEK